MYAIAFDMVVSDIKERYGEPYNNAYFEIRTVLRAYGFYNTQGSAYLTEKNEGRSKSKQLKAGIG
jgi:virulence-associated protein VapD